VTDDKLEGDEPLGPDDLEMIGLLRHAGGTEAPDPWDRIRGVARPYRGNRWALAGWAVAASIVLFLLARPAPPEPLPAGPAKAPLEAAMEAFDPTAAPPMARLAALHAVAAPARARVVAELTR